MSSLPTTLTYFASIQSVIPILQKKALPLLHFDELNDPFLPNHESKLGFDVNQLFEMAVKYITSAITGRTPPRGQPNHPLQKAIARWRMESRFNDESEIKNALLGLLPAMVEQSFRTANQQHQDWLEFLKSKRVVSLFENYQALDLWERGGVPHRSIGIKFNVDEASVFRLSEACLYSKLPPKTVDERAILQHMAGDIPELEFDLKSIALSQNYVKRHQKEWRITIDDNDLAEQWIEFPKTLIKGFYIGALVPPKVVSQLTSHIKAIIPKTAIYQAQCNSTSYDLSFNKLD
ncbi:hypothetical protein [Aliikangiella sp. IMCC44632]